MSLNTKVSFAIDNKERKLKDTSKYFTFCESQYDVFQDHA